MRRGDSWEGFRGGLVGDWRVNEEEVGRVEEPDYMLQERQRSGRRFAPSFMAGMNPRPSTGTACRALRGQTMRGMNSPVEEA